MKRKNLLLIILLFLTSSLLSGNVFNDKDIDEKIIIQKTLKIKHVKRIFNDFLFITGESEERFNSMLSEAYKKDIHFLRAMSALSNFNKKVKINFYDPSVAKHKLIKSSIPDYNFIFNELHESIIKYNNILSAYEGAALIGQRILMLDSTGEISSSDVHKLINTHYPIFIKTLVDQSYCYGYSLGVNFYDSNSEFAKDKKKYTFFIKKGFPLCKTQYSKKEIPKFLYMVLATKKARDDSLIVLENRKQAFLKKKKEEDMNAFKKTNDLMKSSIKSRDLKNGKSKKGVLIKND